ncbi:MAG: nitrilase-related carbon-nitrogen hydrolase [Planctomycetota bacterium]
MEDSLADAPDAPLEPTPGSSSRERASGHFFLGGLFSALFLGLSLPPSNHRLMPWFALTPFLYSLYRNRDSLGARLFHGICFGATLSSWFLAPIFRSVLNESLDESTASAILNTVAEAGLPWLVLTSCWALFAVLSGWVLRSGCPWTALAALPFTWTGIEYVRLECLPYTFPHLVLGSTLDPESPEAQGAALLGVYGLGLAIVFVNTSFTMALVQTRWKLQAALATLASVVVVALATLGPSTALESGRRAPIRMGIVQVARGNSHTAPLEIAQTLLPSSPAIIVFPERVFSDSTSDTVAQEALAAFAKTEEVSLLCGQGTETSEVLLIDSSGSKGGSTTAGSRLWFGDSKRMEGDPALIDATGATRIGAGVDADFLHPGSARRLTASGAEILVCVASDPSRWGRLFALLHDRMCALRAVENGRWLVRATQGGVSSVTSPDGRSILRSPAGLDWGAAENIGRQEGLTFYTRFGWWIGPLSLIGLAVVFVQAVRARRARRG